MWYQHFLDFNNKLKKSLRVAIATYGTPCKGYDAKEIHICDSRLSYINGKLVWLDEDGYQYDFSTKDLDEICDGYDAFLNKKGVNSADAE
jgi:hypothetical protein